MVGEDVEPARVRKVERSPKKVEVTANRRKNTSDLKENTSGFGQEVKRIFDP
jgi:hypothetical protein